MMRCTYVSWKHYVKKNPEIRYKLRALFPGDNQREENPLEQTPLWILVFFTVSSIAIAFSPKCRSYFLQLDGVSCNKSMFITEFDMSFWCSLVSIVSSSVSNSVSLQSHKMSTASFTQSKFWVSMSRSDSSQQ